MVNMIGDGFRVDDEYLNELIQLGLLIFSRGPSKFTIPPDFVPFNRNAPSEDYSHIFDALKYLIRENINDRPEN